LEELASAAGVLAVEWPDRLTGSWPGAQRIEIEILDGDMRRITWSG
jgi:tRNA A37 threonylcarbamoyladenosine biosynthesis protein TsaE